MNPSNIHRAGRVGACLALSVLLITAAGCNRGWYRRQADAEAYALVREKGVHPQWAMDDYSIAVDPRSRMHYQYNPDCPPMPEDDPYSYQLMQCVDGKRGWPFWEDNGHDPFRDNPVWMDYLNFDERGIVLVSADDAVRLGLLHSREYQRSLETLYLSALDVSFERFQFDLQLFSSHGANFATSTGGANSYTLNTFDAAAEKTFTTGSTAVLGLANTLMWNFGSGGDSYTSTTLFDYALIQPLLRNAGRERIMERLTVAERTLLANVRAMEFYRQGFYVNVMTGEGGNNGPTRRGGVFGAGLTGFTGVGGGGFGGVGGGGGAGGGGGFGGAGAGAGQAGGYLGLLQRQQQIRNQEDNVERLRSNLYRLEQTLIELRTRSGEPQLVSNILRQDLQVAQARQALFNAESELLNARNTFQTNIDNFKITLGLPPQLCVEVKDTLLDEFRLIDPATIEQQIALEQLIAEFGEVRLRIAEHISIKAVPDPANPEQTRPVQVIEWYPELEADLNELKARLAPFREVRDRLLASQLPRTKEDLKRLEDAIPRRKQRLVTLKQKLEESREESCPLLPVPKINDEIFRSNRMNLLLDELQKQLAELEKTVQEGYERSLSDREMKIDKLLSEGKTYPPEKLFTELLDVLYPKKRLDVPPTEQVADILVVLPADLLVLQLVQARARTETIELAPVDLRAEEALDIARRYRLDWMNARAALVDSWRLIEFNADQLESTLDVFMRGNVVDTSNASPTGTFNLGLRFDPPLTRLGERNTYRQALIEYQQARRSYVQYEDNTARSLRGRIRTIQNNELNFELQRLAVLEAARQIDRNEDIRIESELSGQATGATAARDAVSALSDLLVAQNNFMSIWVDIETSRRNLDLELGTLQLDQDGLWIDPGVINAEYGQIDPWVRVENNFVLPGASLPEPLPPPPAEPIPQGALPGAAPDHTAGHSIENAATAAVPTSGPLEPVRGQEAWPYDQHLIQPAGARAGVANPPQIPAADSSPLPAAVP